jgi:hypothetical protein
MNRTINIEGIEVAIPEALYEKIKEEFLKKEDVIDDLLRVRTNTYFYQIQDTGKIYKCSSEFNRFLQMNESISEEQLESILELNKLANVARVLNDGWLPNSSSECHALSVNLYFKTAEAKQKAIKLLGEESIRKALTLNH